MRIGSVTMKQESHREITVLLLASLIICWVEGFQHFSPCNSKFRRRTSSSVLFMKQEQQQQQMLVEKTDEEWKEILTEDQYYVLREEGTEAPNSSELNFVKEPGTFICVACDEPLFTTDKKFDSGTGWPSFSSPIDQNSICMSTDFKLLLPRTECSCRTCGGHLGHVFDDGPEPTGQRFCMNGVTMKFRPDEENPELAASVIKKQQLAPYKVTILQALPGILTNLFVGKLFLDSFVKSGGFSIAAPLTAALPLIPALYFAYMAVKSFGRLLG